MSARLLSSALRRALPSVNMLSSTFNAGHRSMRFTSPLSRSFSSSVSSASSSSASSSSNLSVEQRLDAASAAADSELANITPADVEKYRQEMSEGAQSEEEVIDAEDEHATQIDDAAPIDPETAELLQKLHDHVVAARDPQELIASRSSPTERAWLEQLRLDVESLNRYGVAPRVPASNGGAGVPVEASEVYFTFRAFDLPLLRTFTERLAQKALALNLDCFSVVPLPTKIKKWTVLSSPFVDKEARTQFEMRVHKRLVVVKTRGLEKRLYSNRFDHWAAQARIHRLIEIFMRFMPGIQVTFHHKVIRRV